jgi:hypothetical protein
MLNALTNVCFEEKNGHDAGATPFSLMTPTLSTLPTSLIEALQASHYKWAAVFQPIETWSMSALGHYDTVPDH